MIGVMMGVMGTACMLALNTVAVVRVGFSQASAQGPIWSLICAGNLAASVVLLAAPGFRAAPPPRGGTS